MRLTRSAREMVSRIDVAANVKQYCATTHRKAGAAEDGDPGRVMVGADLCGDPAATAPPSPSSFRRAAISCAHAHSHRSLVPASRLARSPSTRLMEGLSARAHLLHSLQLLFGRQLRHQPNRNCSRCTAPGVADLSSREVFGDVGVQHARSSPHALTTAGSVGTGCGLETRNYSHTKYGICMESTTSL